jgi:hypothetical protein
VVTDTDGFGVLPGVVSDGEGPGVVTDGVGFGV